MRFQDCFAFLAARLRDEIIVTSAGSTSELWWKLTGETERVFYLEASMSLASLFAAGIAVGVPKQTVVAFSGDGAFCMNPGMLMVERQLALPNLKRFMVSNHCYDSTNELTLPFGDFVDYPGMARAAGIERVYAFASGMLSESIDFCIARIDRSSHRSRRTRRRGADRNHRPATRRRFNHGTRLISAQYIASIRGASGRVNHWQDGAEGQARHGRCNIRAASGSCLRRTRTDRRGGACQQCGN
jgi:hypothetical protein